MCYFRQFFPEKVINTTKRIHSILIRAAKVKKDFTGCIKKKKKSLPGQKPLNKQFRNEAVFYSLFVCSVIAGLTRNPLK